MLAIATDGTYVDEVCGLKYFLQSYDYKEESMQTRRVLARVWVSNIRAESKALSAPTELMRAKTLSLSSEVAWVPSTYAEAAWPMRQGVLGITRTCRQS